MDEDQEYARRILAVLARLCEKVLDIKPTFETVTLLKLVHHCLKECLPSNDVAEVFISCISRSLLQYKSLKKNEDLTENEKAIARGASSACTRILDILKASFIEEYSNKSAIRPDNDVVFIEGFEDPSEEIIVANRILLDNEFVRALTEKFMKNEKFGNEILETNYISLEKVLSAPHGFLVKQLKEERTINLLINTLKIYSHKSKLINYALTTGKN